MIRPPPTSTLFPYTTLFRSKGGFSRNAEKVAHNKVAAFLHSQLTGNGEGRGFNRHGHALENECIQERGPRAQRVECDKNFAGTGDERNHCPSAARENAAPPPIKFAHRVVECFAPLHERTPFRRLNETCDDYADEAKHAEALRNVEPGDGSDPEKGPY